MSAAERQRRYKARHPERVRENAKAFRSRHHPRLRAEGNAREKRRRDEARMAVLEALGAFCADCGFSDPRALQIEHVNDDGHIERKRFNRDYVRMRRHIAKMINSGAYQILCANCNWIKEIERRRCNQHPPHRPEAGL